MRQYIAKCHEAFRTGLRAMFDARCFGKGYPGYWRFAKTYSEIIRRVFRDATPDLVITDHNYPYDPRGFKYAGISDISVNKAIIFSDYWEIAEHYRDEFVRFIRDNKVNFILSYFSQPLEIWEGSPIEKSFICLPPSFDPVIFNDWQMPKIYDVGFLAAGTNQPSSFYPERFRIHQTILKSAKLRYLWAPHPGWGNFSDKHPLVGRGFSRAINSCRMFITTGGIYRNAHAKYVEILASGTLLMADEPVNFERLRLHDGVNYVKISEQDVMDKIEYYLDRPDLCAKIAENGYNTALRYHTCYARALDFREAMAERTQT